jgi:hypothetical protein
LQEFAMLVLCRLALLAAVVALFSSLTPAQASNPSHTSGRSSPPAGASSQATPSAKKYFVKLHSVPSFCVADAPASYEKAMTMTIISVAKPTAQPCPPHTVLVASSVTTAEIAKAIASDSEYSFDPVTSDKIAIYFTGDPQKARLRLGEIDASLDELAGTDLRYAEIVRVSGVTAKQAVDFLNSLKAAGITANPVDGDSGSSIMLKSSVVPQQALIDDLKKRLFDLRWQQQIFPPTQRLFHLNAASAVKSLSGSSDSSGASGAADKQADKKTDSSTAKTGDSATSTASPSVSVTVTAGAPPSDPNKPASPADLKDGADSKSADAKPADTKPATATATSPQKPAASADSTPKPPSMQTVNDTVVYTNADGTDRGFLEKNRLMAVLDLPRPEVLLNMWSLQASSRDYRVTNAEAEAAHSAVTQHNQLLQDAIDAGWSYLSEQMRYDLPKNPPEKKPAGKQLAFFDPKFYNYITQRFASDDSGSDPDKTNFITNHRAQWGWCDLKTYCLGFTHAFEPLRPTFTNILLAIIAANNPAEAAAGTIQAMDGECPPHLVALPEIPCPSPRQTPPTLNEKSYSGQVDHFQKCISRHAREIQTALKQNGAEDCELKDRATLSAQIESHLSEHLQLNCFQEQAEKSFENDSSKQSSRVGLLRAAIADFLFNYKWATQYPHSFVPYDLSQSAQELNAELNPLILAFNRDVAAFTQSLQTEMQCKYDSLPRPFALTRWFTKGDETFLNDGMIAVRGISGVNSVVDTVTQSFFDATKPPSLTDLLKSVSDAEQNIPGVLKTNLSANEAAVLIGALNSVKPAEAKIGRQLKLDITPHALAGASSAELDVKLTAEEAGSPTYFTADKSTEDTLSRVSTHDTTTKVRVESLKLFEVSAFSAMLQRPRSKFPLLPPLFEVPYFGSFISVPIPGAKVYHRSSAIVSAVIVPTAADLAYGIDFTADRVCEPSKEDLNHYVCHRANFPSDFAGLPLRNYHRAIVQCFASLRQTAYPGLEMFLQESDLSAEHLTPQTTDSLHTNPDQTKEHYVAPSSMILQDPRKLLDFQRTASEVCYKDNLNFDTIPPNDATAR